MRRNGLEWAILAVSLALVAALVGYLAISGLSNVGPAALRASADPGQATEGPGGAWLVPVTVRNGGGMAAVSIVVEGTATVGGVEEASEITVDVLAAESEVELMLGFSARPEDDVRVRIVGYETP
jgi:uncharacterized protein (TIGR02588 family)